MGLFWTRTHWLHWMSPVHQQIQLASVDGVCVCVGGGGLFSIFLWLISWTTSLCDLGELLSRCIGKKWMEEARLETIGTLKDTLLVYGHPHFIWLPPQQVVDWTTEKQEVWKIIQGSLCYPLRVNDHDEVQGVFSLGVSNWKLWTSRFLCVCFQVSPLHGWSTLCYAAQLSVCFVYLMMLGVIFCRLFWIFV